MKATIVSGSHSSSHRYQSIEDVDDTEAQAVDVHRSTTKTFTSFKIMSLALLASILIFLLVWTCSRRVETFPHLDFLTKESNAEIMATAPEDISPQLQTPAPKVSANNIIHVASIDESSLPQHDLPKSTDGLNDNANDESGANDIHKESEELLSGNNKASSDAARTFRTDYTIADNTNVAAASALTIGVATDVGGALCDMVSAMNDVKTPMYYSWRCSGKIPVTDPCASTPWYGLTCTQQAVTKINLYNVGLSGTVPASIGKLTDLTFLSLGSNSLKGSIPVSVTGLANLKFIYLDNNKFSYHGLPGEWMCNFPIGNAYWALKNSGFGCKMSCIKNFDLTCNEPIQMYNCISPGAVSPC